MPCKISATPAGVAGGALHRGRCAIRTAGRLPPSRRQLQPVRIAKGDEVSKKKADGFMGNLEDFAEDLLPEHEAPGPVKLRPKGWIQEETVDVGDFDPLRDGPLRYLGYANELGESFIAWLPPGGVPLSYAIAITYVLVDTYDKGSSARKQAEAQLAKKSAALPAGLDKDRLATVIGVERAVDTVVWQLLASVCIPGYTIHQVVHFTSAVLHPHMEHLSPFETEELASAATALHVALGILIATIDKMVPTMVGLLTIPFIVHPIDESVHKLLDFALRPALKSFICNNMATMAGRRFRLNTSSLIRLSAECGRPPLNNRLDRI